MDSITHILLGASVGEAVLGKKIGKKAMLFGAIAGSMPDIDSVMNFFVSDLESLIWHRGFTHSFLAAFIFGPLLGWLTWKYFRKQQSGLFDWTLLFTLNIILHDLLDTATMYGTKLLYPFSQHRYSFDTIFVVDPLYSIPLLVSVIALLILRRDHHSRENWNKFGLGISSLYMAFTFTAHQAAVNALGNAVNLEEKATSEYIAVPTLFNSILWYTVVKSDDGFKAGYYSLFDEDSVPELYFIPRNDHISQKLSAEQKDALLKLADFSNGFYCLTEENGRIFFNDLRFSQVEGWNDPNSTFSFSFDLTAGANNALVVQAGRIEGSKRKMLKSLWTRIRGNPDGVERRIIKD